MADLEKTTIPGLNAPPERIDAATFGQILEMDEEGDDEFSYSIVTGFYEQAESTFKKMDEALKKKDLPDLSSLGHFLKGSSATLGLTRMKNSCEKIQHLGSRKDETGLQDMEEATCLKSIKTEVELLREEYDEVKAALTDYYHTSRKES